MLGLIFLKFADNNYRRHEAEIIAEYQNLKGTQREKKLSDIAIEKCGFYLPDHARYDHLLNLPEEKDIAKALKEAMKAIEEYKPELEGALPKDEYLPLTRTDKTIPKQLLKNFANIPADTTGDLFGQIYEYFLAEIARSEGQKGGEFFTPRSVVRLMVEMIEPRGGKVFDPACGSGGMFVQSEKFVEHHGGRIGDIAIYGQESNQTTWRLCKMNLAIRGIDANIQWNNEGSFLKDAHADLKADFVLANPPFNDSDWKGELLRDDPRWKYGAPPAGNANYAWVQHFIHHLSPTGTAGFVLANGSMSSNTSGEGEIRKKIVEADLVDCMVALPSQLFLAAAVGKSALMAFENPHFWR